ncbi:MAG: adenylate/guanylate cyclase domain-containing protein [Chloroflexota bacterium]
MFDPQVLEEAVATLRKHRNVLGNAVVETAVSALLDQLAAGETAPLIEHFESVAVLQADLSGFTAMSATMDAEQVRDMVNALWSRLDNVVLAWGGLIEQHTGDGLLALFGAPMAQEDDAQRAVLAALDMQVELALFNEAAAVLVETGSLGRHAPQANFKMRIGLHAGPLLWGRVGQSLGQTAVGDTVQIVSRMEKAAPEGGVLISYDVYSRVFGLFEVTPGEPLAVPARAHELPVYVVEREKPRSLRQNAYRGHGIKSGFVGRVAELEQLEFAWQETLNSSVMQVVTLVGEPGIGKTRMFDEFERWLDLMPVQGCLLWANCSREQADVRWSAVKNMLFDFFDIHVRSTSAVARQKFSEGVARMAGSHKISAQEQAHVMGHLLGIDFSASPYVEGLHEDQEKLEQYGRQDLARFLTDLCRQCFPVVLVLENAQWADAVSLDLIEYLLAECYDQPILVVCLARPEFWEKRPFWNVPDDPLSPYRALPLPPLSPIDSRHMTADILAEIRHVPFRLSDLLVSGARGNPFFLEQTIRRLYDLNIIQPQTSGVVVDLAKLETFDIPQTLTDLFQTRLAALPATDRRILEVAAGVGEVFWDGAVLAALKSEMELSLADLQTRLADLEQRDLILRRRSSLVVGSMEYEFLHDKLWEAVYAQAAQGSDKP